MERETAWLLEKDGLCLGADKDGGVHWTPFTLPEVLRFSRREDAEAVQRLLVRVREKGIRVCPRDVGIAVATEHAWVDAPSREVSGELHNPQIPRDPDDFSHT